MFRILIVDDEPLVAANIKAALYDIRDMFSVIAIAHSGKEALSVIEDQLPDIVITDIMMPGISGIDLIRICSERFPSIRFIIVSGYADFSYAQAAIECGAFAYCLKPLQDEDLQNAITRAAKSSPSAHDCNAEFWEYLNNPENESIDLASYLANRSYHWEECKPFLVLYAIGEGCSPLAQYPHLRIYAGRRKQLVLISQEYRNALDKALSEWNRSNDLKLSIGYGGVASTIGSLSSKITIAQENAYSFFLTGHHGYFNSLNQNTCCEDALRELEYTILQRDITSIKSMFEKLTKQFLSGEADIRFALLCYNTITYRLAPERTEERDYIFDFDLLVQLFPNALTMCENLMRQTMASIMTIDSVLVETEKIKNKTLQSIVAYINDNFWKDLSVQNIADHFFVNMSYLCQIFKKETGYTITEYINQLRIEQARALIHNSSFSLGEICEKVGYADYCHFSKVFRRITGKSPLQYTKDLSISNK